MLGTIQKDPHSTLDYKINWSTWLEGDIIISSVWSVPTGLVDEGLSEFTDTTTTVWLSGGTAGTSYVITNTITTAAGRTEDDSFKITVKE